MDASDLEQEVVNQHDHRSVNDSKSEDNECEVNTCANSYWPLVVFIILAVIVLIGVLFASSLSTNQKTWTFFILLFVFIIWAFIIWAFCKCGQQTIAWFLLLLPIAVAIFWAIAYFMAAVTCGNCPSKTIGCPTEKKCEPCDN